MTFLPLPQQPTKDWSQSGPNTADFLAREKISLSWFSTYIIRKLMVAKTTGHVAKIYSHGNDM